MLLANGVRVPGSVKLAKPADRPCCPLAGSLRALGLEPRHTKRCLAQVRARLRTLRAFEVEQDERVGACCWEAVVCQVNGWPVVHNRNCEEA